MSDRPPPRERDTCTEAELRPVLRVPMCSRRQEASIPVEEDLRPGRPRWTVECRATHVARHIPCNVGDSRIVVRDKDSGASSSVASCAVVFGSAWDVKLEEGSSEMRVYGQQHVQDADAVVLELTGPIRAPGVLKCLATVRQGAQGGGGPACETMVCNLHAAQQDGRKGKFIRARGGNRPRMMMCTRS
ncbi:hypothetical protein PYCCODRAFT_1011277 [Trametes coccinea BRFM310]|uniref:Uncharacterized protein n=1 Tax=Trametes coccinea (strain BRFM310) TaxID=1353009 RepID=A0A1Y2ICQ6_TRAC3|nr:hypothetical protein PYCCODRAFT_1011277 [Trametes coccinea BRFM310]